MTVVRGYLRMLLSERHGVLNPDQWSFASEARRSTERVLLMLDNLLELSNQTGGQPLPVVRKPVHLREVLVQAVATARPLLDDAGIKVDLALEDLDDAHLQADPDRLEQVFVNLISNAVAHSPEDGHVSLQASVIELDDGPFVTVAVADHGPGIAPEDVHSIFEPFVRGKDARSGGVGLGLAICARIIQMHGGAIEAVPSAGRGLFRVTLPLSRPEA